jgi:hypothetical protein
MFPPGVYRNYRDPKTYIMVSHAIIELAIFSIFLGIQRNGYAIEVTNVYQQEK